MSITARDESRLREIVRAANATRPGTFAFAYWLPNAPAPLDRVYLVGGGKRPLRAYFTRTGRSLAAQSTMVAEAAGTPAEQYAILAERLERFAAGFNETSKAEGRS